MRRVVLLIFCLLLLTGGASALNPVNVAISTSNPWVVANLSDSSVITVIVTDGAGKAIPDANVTLSLTTPWALDLAAGMTNQAGAFQARFLPTKKAGDAVITASVEVTGITTVPVLGTFTQNVTADTPATQDRLYPRAATIGATTTISVTIKDKHGNPVDSRKDKTNQVTFATTLTGNNGFLDEKDPKKNKVKGISVPLDATGTAATDFVLDTKPGPNFITIDPPRPLPPTLISIQGIADRIPAAITLTVDPQGDPPTLIADTSPFILTYQLTDQFGNPSSHQKLLISTSAGEALTVSSNNQGGITVTYGPKSTAGKYTVTATAEKNSSVMVTQVLKFASNNPTDMLLTASPQSMPSLDVRADMVSSVMAKVIDPIGNPVSGETVTFSLLSVTAGASQTVPPSIQIGKTRTDVLLVELTTVTDVNGIAALDFYPGTFAKGSDAADGVARVRARWSGVTRDLDISYKNYPYLSVSTSVEPMTVEIGKEVNVSIRLRGDGYALIPKPVDVLMLTDRSGSMLRDYPDRMVEEKGAAHDFANQFNLKKDGDQVGQLSFGANYRVWAKNEPNCGLDGDSHDDVAYASVHYPKDGKTYSDWAVLDQGLTDKKTTIDNAIDGLVPGGWTPMRRALYDGITVMKNTGRPAAIRALVVMSDGDYNRFGDPLARGKAGSSDPNAYGDLAPDYVAFAGLPSQSMADYAKANSVRIYTIGYAADISSGGQQTLETLASLTGGKYFYAATGAGLQDVYKKIAGDLKEAAGVNTKMVLNFQQVEVNGEPKVGKQVFTYVNRKNVSTFFVPPPPREPWTENSGTQWDTGMLNFDLGTIKVNEEWVVNFTLKVNEGGNIKVLGGNSMILFDEGKGTLTLPDTYLTAIPEGTEGGLGTLTLRITNLKRTNPDSDREWANLEWNISYDGRREWISEEIEVATLNPLLVWGQMGSKTVRSGEVSDSFPLDISNLGPGTYKIRVTGYVGDAEPSFDEIELTIPVTQQTPRILIR